MVKPKCARIRSRIGVGAALVALAAPAVTAAAPATSGGNANFRLRIKVKQGGWKNSQALKLFAYGGARQTRVNRATRTIFPVKSIDFALSQPVVYLQGGVVLQLPNTKGKRARLGALRVVVEPTSTTIVGRFHGGQLVPVLRSARRASFDPVAGNVRLGGSGLQLTPQSRHVLHKRIGVHVEHGAAGTGGPGGQAEPILARAGRARRRS